MVYRHLPRSLLIKREKSRISLFPNSWEGHHLNLRAGDQQKQKYLKLKPNAVVPTLVDGGTVIIESTVINEYLDDAYPEPRLKPDDAAGRARMRLWTKQLDEGVHAATSVVSSAIAFRYFSGTIARTFPSGTIACVSAGVMPKLWKSGSTRIICR